jgi:DNA-3-methyladenine glycosylase I
MARRTSAPSEAAPLADGLVRGGDGVVRCWWAADAGDGLYPRYHDEEWGRPVDDDRRLFEKICLEGFQSGLSWLTILRKRENFRRAFHDFDFQAVAEFNGRDVSRLLKDAGIVRHRGKIESTINNAGRAVDLREEFGSLAAYFWRFEPPPEQRPPSFTKAALSKLAQTEASKALSLDLRKRGWSFVGPTTLYAFMQAVGLVNDHLEGCPARKQVQAARAAFVLPK